MKISQIALSMNIAKHISQTSWIGIVRKLKKKLIVSSFIIYRVSGIFDFSSPVYIIRDPQMIKQLTVKEFDHFLDHKFMLDGDPDSMFSRTLFNLRGQKWKGLY